MRRWEVWLLFSWLAVIASLVARGVNEAWLKEGRRIERVDGGYLILNYLKYRELRDEDVRREKDRERQRRHREKWRDLSRSVTPCHAPSRQAEAEAEAEAEVEAEEEKEKVKRKKIGGFRPPALEDVKAFVEQEALGFDAEEWYYYWQGQGWKRKGGPIKDWQATARNWAKRKAPTPAKKQDVDEVAQYMKDHPGALFVPFG